MTAPSPALYAQGDAVLACGLPGVVCVVFPADREGRRLYAVEWPAPPGWLSGGGVFDERELVPAGRA